VEGKEVVGEIMAKIMAYAPRQNGAHGGCAVIHFPDETGVSHRMVRD
jgi:hypothetical protein